MAVSAIAGLVSAVAGGIASGFALATFATSFAIGAGLSMVSRALAPKPNIGAQMRGITQTTREPASSRKIIYGKMRVGGQVVFIKHSGTDNKYLNLAVVFATHEIHAFNQIWFNDKKIWTASGGFVDDWGTYVDIERKFGTAGQSASTILTSASNAWTSDNHKLSGMAYIAFKLEWNPDKFPQGVPNITAVIRGKKVYDPRTQTTAYSQNPALCLRDYMLDEKYGLGEVAANINNQSVIDAANLCDESIDLDGGDTQDRYQCNGVIDTANQIKANIEQILSSMGGQLTYSGGEYFMKGAGKIAIDAGSFVVGTKYRILTIGTTDFTAIGATSNTVDLEFTATGVGSGTGTAYLAATIEFTEADIISDIQTQTKQSRRGIYNGVKGIFVSEEKNYKVLDYPAQISSTYETEDGDPIYLDMPLPCVTNNFQAQRLAKIALLKSRQQVVITMTTNLKGLRVKVGDIIKITNDHINYDEKLFEVIDYSLAISDGALGVNLTCIETAAAIYDWNTSDEEDFLSGGELDLYDGRTVQDVTNLSKTEIATVGPDGTLTTSVELTWTAPDDAFVDFYKVRWNKNGETNYFHAETKETRILISGLDVTASYDFRVQVQNLLGVTSVGVTLTDQGLVGDEGIPGKPTLGTITGGIRQITCEWDNPDDVDYSHTEVFVKDSNTTPLTNATPTAKVTGEEYVAPVGSGAITKFFFLRAVDFSGNKSGFTGTTNNSGTSTAAQSADIDTDAVGTTQIDDSAVGTDQIAGGAVTTPESIFTQAAQSTSQNTSGQVEAQSVDIVSVGKPLEIFASFTIENTGNIAGTVTVRLKRGTTVLSTATLHLTTVAETQFAAAFLDTRTDQETRTYSVTIEGTPARDVSNRYMRGLELKR